MPVIDDLPPLRDVIATHELAAKKSLGQNFLLDLNLTAKIARLAGDLSGADVLEIGPGPGGLTRGVLAEGARRVLAIEKDPRCMPALAEIAAAYPGRLQSINGRLALPAQWRTDPKIEMDLPPEAFSPPPKVNSAVVHLAALPAPRYPADPGTLNMVVAAAFNQRRKMLRSALKSVSPDIEAHLIAAGIKPPARAEQVGLEAFCALARAVDAD